MRIVFFEFVIHYGGSAMCLVDLARRLAEHVDVSIVDVYGSCRLFVEDIRKAGLDHHVLCPEETAQFIGGKGRPLARMARMLAAMPGLMKVRRRAAEVLGDLNPSFVLSYNFKSLSMIGFSRKLRHIPMGMYMQGWYTPNMLSSYRRRLCRNRLDAMIAVSHPTRSALMCSGIDPKRITLIHNPVDVDEMIENAQGEPESPLPMRDKPVRIVVPATVFRAKGQHTAVEALPQILDAGHDAVLWLAGTVPDLEEGQRRYVQGLRETAERLGVADRLHMLGMRRDMPQVFQAATAVVLPTHAEGHPRVILEAMALAKPVAGTPAGGMTDMILPTVTGLFFEVEDAVALAGCVNCFASQPDQAQAMGLRAQQYMRDNFRPDQQTQRILRLLERIDGRHGG